MKSGSSAGSSYIPERTGGALCVWVALMVSLLMSNPKTTTGKFRTQIGLKILRCQIAREEDCLLQTVVLVIRVSTASAVAVRGLIAVSASRA